MSRIHEALRRAEQSQPSGPSQGGSTIEVLASVIAGSSQEPLVSDPAMAAVGGEAESVAATPGLLDERCSRPEWNPDLDGALFVSDRQNHAVEHEQFRTLRSRLCQLRSNQAIKVLLIASALPLEGKTFVAANLSQVMAQQPESRVLLVDADLRKPRLHQLFGAPRCPGLSDYLQGKADALAIIQKSPLFDRLYFVPGGESVTNPGELIANDRLRPFINRVGHLVDWIILDSPPATPVTDASLIADICDGVVLVVKADATPFDTAQKAREEFRRKPVLGAVLNGVPTQGWHRKYYHDLYDQSGSSK